MIVNCQYSNERFTLPDFGDLRITYVHPIFSAETKFLLSRTGYWARGELNERERKLLFLALLHSTDLVAFKAAATPVDAVVQSNMEGLIRLVNWIDSLKNPAVVLPSFVITHETRSLVNVRYWLAAWWEARKDFEDGYKEQASANKQLAREKALERLIKTSSKKTEEYMGLLATWAMEAANVPMDLRPHWKSILCSRSNSIYTISAADLSEILEHMEENLYPGSIFAFDFMKALRLLVQKNKAGLSYGLGMSENAEMDYRNLVSTPFVMLDGDTNTETANKMLIVNNAPEFPPKQSDYPSRVAYLRAKIAFEMAEKARQYRMDTEAEMQRLVQQDAIDAADTDSEAGEVDPDVRNTDDGDEDAAN